MIKIKELTNDTWMDHGRCVTERMDPDFFFPTVTAGRRTNGEGNLEYVQGKRASYCHGFGDYPGRACPVRLECLKYALDNREDGVWGGTTEWERVQIRKQRARKKTA